VFVAVDQILELVRHRLLERSLPVDELRASGLRSMVVVVIYGGSNLDIFKMVRGKK
jgi:hypothetical protein